MNVLIVVGGAMSALVVVLFVYVVYLIGGVDLDGPFFLRGVFMIRCPRCQSEGIRRSRRRVFLNAAL